jgi:spermidine synthase
VHPLLLSLIYLMFFLSGAAALMYQVVWVRSLTLVFGGTHLAVTAVLSIFMAGLALGGYTIGKYVDRVKRPLRLYGLLELGIALFAVIFIGLIRLYPLVYIALAQGKDNAHLYLAFIRLIFSVIALIVPTSLMGGTLPVLSKFIAGHPKNLRVHLSFLYGINTLGAVVGVIGAGFFLLRFYSLSTTLYLAIIANVSIGVAAVLLQPKATTVLETGTIRTEYGKGSSETGAPDLSTAESFNNLFALKLVLWGIGVSGFCALGYEVLWTRILTIVMSASVYSFATMLVAFLTGIALGSGVYGLIPKVFRLSDRGVGRSISWFGIVQVIIGVTALLVTIYIRDLPMNLMGLHGFFQSIGISLFGVRIWSGFALAFLYMVVPTFFMGLAFPLAGKVHAQYRKVVGGAVGEILAYNTVGAILGAAVSGFVMIYLFGIERSLQMLIVINIGYGLLVFFSVRKNKVLNLLVPTTTLAAFLFLVFSHNGLRIWETKYFAIFRSNELGAFATPEKIRDALENTDVLYYGEGIEAVVSSVKVKGGEQDFVTNGRTEASTDLKDQQVMFALSHLPMLLHKNPKKVLVVGLGSGMTLGAISVHPSVEEITLVELEPKVLGVARTFADYNHHVLDNPKVKIYFNDGRNFLMTTREKFDVITADPIHPWFRGAGYLYTNEYFTLASEHLRPGGIICQWLPIYELTPEDLKSVVLTFRQQFKHTLLWLTHYDAELIGSNSPIIIDEAELSKRISEPLIHSDLKRVMMGSATDLLSYFLMGTKGMKAFSQGGIINTDDNLYLEYSAPFSIGNPSLMGRNVSALTQYRENILPYLLKPTDPEEQARQEKRWAGFLEASELRGRASSLFLSGLFKTPEFGKLLGELETKYPDFAPARFLKYERDLVLAREPRLLQKTVLILQNEQGAVVSVEISAVLVPVSSKRASVMFVDNAARVVYGELYFSGLNYGQHMDQFVDEVMRNIRSFYRREAWNALRKGSKFPAVSSTLKEIKEIIKVKVQENIPEKVPG